MGQCKMQASANAADALCQSPSACLLQSSPFGLGEWRMDDTTALLTDASPHDKLSSPRTGITMSHGGTSTSYVPFDVSSGSPGSTKEKTDDSYHADIPVDVEKGLLGSSSNDGEEHYLAGGKRPLREQFTAFKTMAMPFFRESRDGRCCFYVLVVLVLLNSAVRVIFSYTVRDFYNALEQKDPQQFYNVMMKFIAALGVFVPIVVLYRFQRQRLAIKWRDWMTGRLMQLYYSNRVYYCLERGREIDNPDQRIAEDVKTFTEQSLMLFLNIVTSSIDLVSFSIILATIEANLFFAIGLYASFGTLATYRIGKKLIHLNFDKLQREAHFRYSLLRIRENAESVAFYHGEDIEEKEVGHRFGSVIGNMKELNVAQRNLDFFTQFYNYFNWILPVVVIAPQYFAGAIEMGVVTQTSSAFGHVLEDLSLIINQFESLSEFSAGIERLYQFLTAVQRTDPDRGNDPSLLMVPKSVANEGASIFSRNSSSEAAKIDTIQLNQQPLLCKHMGGRGSASSVALSLKKVALSTPDHSRRLLNNISLSLNWGQNLLIAGPSGIGKSSLLRAISGLWTSGTGAMERPDDLDCYFLPQRPYCALGSLRDQLLYPSTSQLSSDDFPAGHQVSGTHVLSESMTPSRLLAILSLVDLLHIAERAGRGDSIRGLDVVSDWSNILSLGEQQRLAFGRILVNRPHLVIMDESTSALDVASENKMFELLRGLNEELQRNTGVPLTYISVGHRPTLLRHHDMKLTLKGGSNYTFDAISQKDKDVVSSDSFLSNF